MAWRLIGPNNFDGSKGVFQHPGSPQEINQAYVLLGAASLQDADVGLDMCELNMSSMQTGSNMTLKWGRSGMSYMVNGNLMWHIS